MNIEAIEQILISGMGSEEKIKLLNQLFIKLEQFNSDDIPSILIDIEYLLKNKVIDISWKLELFLISFINQYRQDNLYLNRIFELLNENQDIQPEELYYLYWQLSRELFVSPTFNTNQNRIKIHKLYRNVFNAYNAEFLNQNHWIPLEQRDENLVFVITSQFLSYKHAPTKTALDFCHTLGSMGKRVKLINTAELPRSICFPYYTSSLFNYLEDYNRVGEIVYNQLSISFYQYRSEMPSLDEIGAVLQEISRLKPLFILSIGAPNLTADLGSNFVPVITLPLSVDVPISESTFLVIPRDLREQDELVISNLTQPLDRIIESQLSYQRDTEALQSVRYNRKEWGINEEDFVMVIVGNRLDEEMTEDFVQSLDLLFGRNPNARLLVVGNYDNYHFMSNKYSDFNTHSSFIGYQRDLSAIYSLCDVYLNPPRLGGGVSAAMAIDCGLPVFSFPYGDVSFVTTPEYHIDNLDIMDEYVDKWRIDPQFSMLERNKAKKRAGEIYNPENMLLTVLEKAMKSPAFL